MLVAYVLVLPCVLFRVYVCVHVCMCMPKCVCDSFTNYAPHTVPDETIAFEDGMSHTAMLELMVNRKKGENMREQWVQEPDSVCITGIYIHVISVTQLWKKGYFGQMRIHKQVFEAFEGIEQRQMWRDA